MIAPPSRRTPSPAPRSTGWSGPSRTRVVAHSAAAGPGPAEPCAKRVDRTATGHCRRPHGRPSRWAATLHAGRRAACVLEGPC
eukprot:822965-Prymnesium_polylepis.1